MWAPMGSAVFNGLLLCWIKSKWHLTKIIFSRWEQADFQNSKEGFNNTNLAKLLASPVKRSPLSFPLSLLLFEAAVLVFSHI